MTEQILEATVSSARRGAPRIALAITLALALAIFNCLAIHAGAWERVQFDLTIHAGKHERNNTPVCVPIKLPATLGMARVRLSDAEGHDIAAQIADPGLAEISNRAARNLTTPTPSQGATDANAAKPGSNEAPAEMVARDLYFILAHLDSGATAHLQATLDTAEPKADKSKASGFRWLGMPQDTEFSLFYGDRKVMEYVAPRFNDSTPKLREETYKPFHQLYDPTSARLVTKGVGGNDTHHRGLFYGFNRISYDRGRKHADTWQCLGDAYESHRAFVGTAAGTVLGRHCVIIDWHGEGKQVFAHEERELTAYAAGSGTLVEFVSLLRAAEGPVHLEGDPHHSGFHFRAADEVASKTKKETYYLRPDGVGKPDQTINWDSTPQDSRTSDQPWKGMCFVLAGRRYTAAILDRPDNPKPAHWSERDYGRFGSTFVADVTAERPLLVRYRVWLQNGETTPDRLAALAADFVEPVAVEIQRR